MSINKFALIRYKTINDCLRNRYRQWTLEDLMEACEEALYEYEGSRTGISKRTIQLDIQNMRSEKLGYNAPIIVVDKKYYTYEDKNYSITRNPLTRQDLETLKEVTDVLQQFSAFGYMNELTGMVNKLQDKIHTHQFKTKSLIHYETNSLLKGLGWIEKIHKLMIDSVAMTITYQSFKAQAPRTFTFHAYLLKEYRNRWFVFGKIAGSKHLTNLALDRIIALEPNPQTPFVRNQSVDFDAFFENVIGVTKTEGQIPRRVILRVQKPDAFYILTKPLHPTQEILRETDHDIIISVHVIWNFELEREILGFGEVMKVLAPKVLQLKMIQRYKRALSLYDEEGI